MPDMRNLPLGNSPDLRGTVCIDTKRVFDCCRDRDCFEDTRVYLNPAGEDIIANATSVRARSADLIWAYVGVDEVPFNRGFYQVTVRYYIAVECEVCVGLNSGQVVRGLAVVEKDVVLFGGEGRVISYSSDPMNQYCRIGNLDTVGTNDPVAIVETVEPVVLGTKILCVPDMCQRKEKAIEIPDLIRGRIGNDLIFGFDVPGLFISLGIFSVIRIVRPAQFLVQATDYSVPDKECTPGGSDDNPCSLFRSMAFPVGQFRAIGPTHEDPPKRSNCGCGGHGTGTPV